MCFFVREETEARMRNPGRSLLGLLMAFCLGAVGMLLLLTPGEIKFSDKVKALGDREKREEIVSFESARDRVDDATNRLVDYIRSAREEDS